ncbi:MAG: 50S ribosomal protein L31 [Acidobacteria bacterium]|nr:50S ribosomal protein L31 [Acidobacteriota bacterium]MBI3664500.1 50S ribosomal protein L31 [Acidobacteriota bacterium]
MKPGVHSDYHPLTVHCACGHTFQTHSTIKDKMLRVEICSKEITDEQRVNIGAATSYSGHHTVYQHAHFEFGLENVSRQFVWSFLHAHPFYNSEQQSQRHVRLDRAQACVPA